jgi:hypothetical protein
LPFTGAEAIARHHEILDTDGLSHGNPFSMHG